MNTEITDIEECDGLVLYDADCHICAGLAGRFRHLLAARRLVLLPLQTPWVRVRLGLADSELLAEMRLLKPDGKIFGGADALLEICRYYRLAWPIYRLGKFSVVSRALHFGYRWIARHRNCASGACKLEGQAGRRQSHAPFDFILLLVLPALAFGFRTRFAPWIFMWAMAFAIYAGCKWLTFREARKRGANPSLPRALGYLLLWPGMDAADFLDEKVTVVKPRRTEWAGPLAKIILGTILLGMITRWVFPVHPLLGGWIGMTGIVLLLHFGLFHIASLMWRRAGIAAEPVMQKPLLAKSLAEFWGARWNSAFNALAFQFSYRPLRRRTAPFLATLGVFGLSGLIHELVISLPARGGYGLPTAYFLVQGLGVIAERTRMGQSAGLGHGVRGWLFTLLVTVAPVPWLFHPPFIHHVILPMLTAIGAT